SQVGGERNSRLAICLRCYRSRLIKRLIGTRRGRRLCFCRVRYWPLADLADLADMADLADLGCCTGCRTANVCIWSWRTVAVAPQVFAFRGEAKTLLSRRRIGVAQKKGPHCHKRTAPGPIPSERRSELDPGPACSVPAQP